MLTASEYRKRSRKVVTLPSGGEVEIRKLSARDYLSVGDIPISFAETVRSGDKEQISRILAEDKDFANRMLAVTLMQSVVSMNIVDKPPRECSDDEVSISEIDAADQEFLSAEIAILNGMNKGAGKSIARFQEEPGCAGDAGRDGGKVRETPDGDPGP